MKAAEIRELSSAELAEKLSDLKSELFNLRFQHAINQLENPMRIKAVKKDIGLRFCLDRVIISPSPTFVEKWT